MSVTKTYRGKIDVRDQGESTDLLFVDESDDLKDYWSEPIAMKIEEDIEDHGCYLSVVYWITDEEHPWEEMQGGWIRRVSGDSDVQFTVHCSDITGYLYTDEEIKVGGHDLLAELASYKGKFVHLEITYSPEPKDVL